MSGEEHKEHTTIPPELVPLIKTLKQGLDQFDEVWVVGHRGDQGQNLRELGLFDGLALMHVHEPVGQTAEHVIPIPPNSSTSYLDYVHRLNTEEMETHIERISREGKQVIVLMPFPNSELEKLIREFGAENLLTLTPPTDANLFMYLESKTRMALIIQEALEDMQDNIIRHHIVKPGNTYQEIVTALKISPGQPFYLQLDYSAGGSGTIRIENPHQYRYTVESPKWEAAITANEVKATMGITGRDGAPPYPANGGACIVPTEGGCEVYIDPLSHKPMKKGSYGSIGNDWSQKFTPNVTAQYVQVVTRIGRYLHEEYGYSGYFGPDCLVGVDENGTERVYVNEINMRHQGTTPYQHLNAIATGRPTTLLMHHVTNLHPMEQVLALLPPSEEYNRGIINEPPGGYYIKLHGPDKPIVIRENLNGPWIYTPESQGQRLRRPRFQLSSLLQLFTTEENFEGDARLIWIKSPPQGTQIKSALTPFGYIIGAPGNPPVFESDYPAMTQEGKQLYTAVLSRLLKENVQ